MVKHTIHFIPGSSHPYVRNVIDFKCNGISGELAFDGYYYVNDDSNETLYSYTLPKEEKLYVEVISDDPPIITRQMVPSFLKDENGERPLIEVEHTEYKILEKHFWKILVYKREKLRNTDVISTVTDDDGEEMNICFFPTDEQRIYFQILQSL